jgi:hypothetical protein
VLRGADAHRFPHPLAEGNAEDIDLVSGLPAAADDSGHGDMAPR